MNEPDALPEVRYAAAGAHRVAYVASGQGPIDLVIQPGLWSHMGMVRDDPGHVDFRRRLQRVCRMISFDRFGTGVSDRPADGGPAVAQWLASCEAVLDALKATRPVLVSVFNAGPLMLEFVRRHPGRCAGLGFINTHAGWAARPGYAAGASPQEVAQASAAIVQSWGRDGMPAGSAPSRNGDAAFLGWNAAIQRAMATPDEVAAGLAELAALDTIDVLPTLQVPTLVMVRRGLPPSAQARARHVADHVPGARFVELPGADIAPFYETPERVLDELERFLATSVAP